MLFCSLLVPQPLKASMFDLVVDREQFRSDLEYRFVLAHNLRDQVCIRAGLDVVVIAVPAQKESEKPAFLFPLGSQLPELAPHFGHPLLQRSNIVCISAPLPLEDLESSS